MNWEKKSTKIFIFLTLTFIFILLRIDTLNHIFKYSFLNLIDPDSYYHLRRISYTINNFPKILTFDPYLSHPYGEFVPWPPFFDFLSALITIPFPDSNKVLPFLNPSYFFLAFLIIFLATKKDFVVSTISCFFIAYSGILKIYSSAGRLDHHAFEMLLITVLSITFIEYYKKSGILNLLLMSIILIISFITWPGAIIYSVPIIIFALYKNLVNKNPDHINKGLFIAYHITAIFLAIYLKLSKTIDYYPYSFKFLSGFQRDFCFIVSIIFFTLHLSNKIKEKYSHKKYKKRLVFFIFLLNAVIGATIFKRFFYEIISGLMFISKTEHILKTAEEASPLFFSNIYSLKEELKRNTFLFTPLFFFFPLVIWKFYKKHKINYLFVYTIFFFLLTCFQLRFGFFFMIGYSVMLGQILRTQIRKITPAILIIAFLFLSLLSYNTYSKDASKRFIDEEIFETLVFIKNNTSINRTFEQDNHSNGIISSWEHGHHIIQISSKPAVAHPFIGVAPKNGYMDFIRILFAKDENTVVNIMHNRQSRFLILDNVGSSIKIDWDTTNWGQNPYILNNNFTSKVLELFSYNLFFFYGLTKEGKSVNEQIRIIFESKNSNVKLYEKVKGCKIILKNKKDYILKAKITNGKKIFSYINVGKLVNNDQIFTLPYSTERKYPFFATEIYLEKDGKRKNLNITEDLVIKGSSIVL